MRKGVWSQCGTQCRVCQLTMRAMSGHGELVNAIEGNLPGRSQGLKWPENCSNMSKVFSSLHSRQTCVRVRERILMADGGLSKPGGRQQLIPSNSDCFPMVRRSGGSGIPVTRVSIGERRVGRFDINQAQQAAASAQQNCCYASSLA